MSRKIFKIVGIARQRFTANGLYGGEGGAAAQLAKDSQQGAGIERGLPDEGLAENVGPDPTRSMGCGIRFASYPQALGP